ncbi:MAG: hypothetical protein WBF84_03450 [Castellaniella sp.]|uniref:hypothetical protein n=1 Tax=Castellaniella sp. TaxID=1955812 RepID=UPI003C71DFA5
MTRLSAIPGRLFADLSEDVDRLLDDGGQGRQKAEAQQDDARVPVAETEADEHRDDPQDEEDQEQVAVEKHGSRSMGGDVGIIGSSARTGIEAGQRRSFE